MNNTWTKIATTLAGMILAVGVVSCGGNANEQKLTYKLSAPPQAAPVASDVQQFSGPRANYLITKISVGYVVTDTVGTSGSVTIRDKTKLQFSDVRVNLAIVDLAKTISVNDLNTLIDLYTAFFNRVPDADGLAYWVAQFKAGMSIDQIANHFYNAAIQFSAQTGYSSSMSNQEFILVIYKNVLGRFGSTAPPEVDVNYWAGHLDSGTSKGTMIRSMLVSARGFYNDATWKWVPALLDGKLKVGTSFAIDQGLNYISDVDSITKTMAIAAAVTQTSTSAADKLIPVKDLSFSLKAVPGISAVAGVCTPSSEMSWARSHLDDVYLWYKDIVDVPVTTLPTVENYFDSLLVKQKDRFSSVVDQAGIDDYFQSGKSYSYGYTLIRQGTRLRVLYLQPGSPAELAGLQRGDTIAKIDNTSLEKPANDIQYEALYPTKQEAHLFEIVGADPNNVRTVSMTAIELSISPVLNTKVLNVDDKRIGYFLFTDHITTAEQPLIDAMDTFSKANITDMVLDLRYNGGGYLYIASELASMIGGYRTSSHNFEMLQYNDKHPEKTEKGVTPFYGYDTLGRELPWLSLSRVYILTGSRTCSASESIINGLSPFVEVILIGENTCGKPYGFRQTNNCNKAYFAIQFSGVNDLGKADYLDGFAPKCKVADDLEHALGDANENRLAAAINYMKTGSCPAVTGFSLPLAPKEPAERDPHPWRSIRLVK